MRCKADTQKGGRCKNTAMKDAEFCGVHNPSVEQAENHGRKMSEAEVEKFYIGILEHHIEGNKSQRETAEVLKVSYTTFKKRFPEFTQWLKENQPEEFDGGYMIKRLLARSEARRRTLMDAPAETATEQARIAREVREEENLQLKLLQDIGKIEHSFDGVIVNNQIVADDFRKLFEEEEQE